MWVGQVVDYRDLRITFRLMGQWASMTTNKVIVDEAILSRIHLKIKYDNLTKARRSISQRKKKPSAIQSRGKHVGYIDSLGRL